MHKKGRPYLKRIEDVLNKFTPIYAIGITVLGNLVNLILILRSHPFLLSLGLFKTLFVGFSRTVVPVFDFVYLLLVIYLTKNLRRSIFAKTFLIVILLITIAVTASFIYFSLLETSHYPNFVFSTYFIYLPSLRFYTIFHFLLILVGTGSSYYFLSKRNFVGYIPHLLVLLVLFSNFLTLPNLLVSELNILIKYASAEGRANNKLVEFQDLYTNLSFIVENTESNSVIIHPKQSETFPVIGNQPLIRYVLFPRILVTEELADKFFKENPDFQGSIYYIFTISREKETPIYFPQDSFRAEEIKILLKEGKTMHISDVAYDRDYAKSLGEFMVGIIKIQ